MTRCTLFFLHSLSFFRIVRNDEKTSSLCFVKRTRASDESVCVCVCHGRMNCESADDPLAHPRGCSEAQRLCGLLRGVSPSATAAARAGGTCGSGGSGVAAALLVFFAPFSVAVLGASLLSGASGAAGTGAGSSMGVSGAVSVRRRRWSSAFCFARRSHVFSVSLLALRSFASFFS